MIKYKLKLEDDESDMLEHLVHKDIVDKKNILWHYKKDNAEPLHVRQLEEEIKFLERLNKKVLSSRKVV